jgi:hypothetical protein
LTERVESASPSLPFDGALEWATDRAWIAAWWLGGRALVFATALAVHAFESRPGRTLGVLESWDAHWYRLVASDGYVLVPGRQSDPAFFPLFPLLLRGAHALGLGYATAGIALSNLAFLVALVAVHALSRDLFGDTLARRATIYLAVFPLGYVFSMVYPESLVLAAIATSALAAERGRWAIAGGCAAAAALARPEGLFVGLPLLMLAWRQRRLLTPAGRGLALGAVLAPAAALASFPLYLDRVLHDPLAWSQAQRAWGRRFSPLGFVHAFANLGHALGGNEWLTRDVVAALAYLFLLAAAARMGVGWPWLVSGLAVVVLPVFSGDFDSIGRFGLLAPAILWGLAWLGRRPRVDLVIRVASLVLLVGAVATVPFVFP